MKRVFRFLPIYQQRVWGGRRLGQFPGRSLPGAGFFGESWEVVDRDDAQSVIVGGPFDGMTLRALLETEGRAILGGRYGSGTPFPILVKWLDCRDRLSLQVHPPAEVAPELRGEPKTENWYIADCEPGAGLLAGLKSGVTREAFLAALQDQTLEKLVPRIAVEPGDSLLVRSGRLHAIDAGNLILEIQQNSDTTYRVYDWGRVGLDGKPRDLHIAESLRSIDFDDVEPSVMKTAGQSLTLAECDEFRIRKIEAGPGDSLSLSEDGDPVLLHLVSGSIEIPDTEDGAEPLSAGETVLVPAGADLSARAGEGATVLITDRFLG